MVGDDDDLRVGRLARVEAQAARPSRDDHADVRVRQLVKGERIRNRRGHLIPFHRDLEVDALRRFIQSGHVLFQPEHPSGIGPDTLEHAVAVEQSVVEDADLRV